MNRIFIDDNQHWLESDYPHKDGYDVVYIDPPYDTGTKFSYKDSRADWDEWMQHKLEKTHEVMKDTAALFISIDDSKVMELCLMCDKIFGKKNRLGLIITHQSQRSNSRHINTIHEYVVAYAKDKKKLPKMAVNRKYTDDAPMIKQLTNEVLAKFRSEGQEEAQKLLRKRTSELVAENHDHKWIQNYRCVDEKGRIFFPKDLSTPGTPRKVSLSDIGIELEPLATRGWSSDEKFRELSSKGLIHFLAGRPYEVHYLDDAENSMPSILPFYSRQGTEELKRLGCNDFFDTPKPVGLIELLIMSLIGERSEMKVLDYFGGSGTTAQAVYQAAEKTGCNISYDLVQLDEEMTPGTKPEIAARAAGFEPRIPQALIHRIKAYLKTVDKEPDFEVIRSCDE